MGLEQRRLPTSQLNQGKRWHLWAEVVTPCRPKVSCSFPLGHLYDGATEHPLTGHWFWFCF